MAGNLYFCGDTHGEVDFHKLNSKHIQGHITEQDYVIICGDAGVVWDGGKSDRYIQNWYLSKPWTTLFVDGNHENFDLLSQFSTYNWNGGEIHKINDKLFHLKRGQIFNIKGKTLFTMGGAPSTDKIHRKEGVSWWAQEIPSREEFDLGLENLAKHNNRVDYIVTHDVPDKILDTLSHNNYKHNIVTNYLEVLRTTVNYNHWFSGHYHIDKDFDEDGISILYNRVVTIV